MGSDARATLDPRLAGALAAWLEKDLLGDQYARLEQAGSSDDDKIPLARVFVDLEVSATGREDPSGNAEGFVARMLSALPEHLSGAVEAGRAAEARPRDRRPRGGFVLIGGPGQGKSTLGQFLCQLHRAALLAPQRSSLSRAAQQALRALEAQCGESGFALPTTGALPVRVVLGELAAWIANTGVSPQQALFTYLAERLARAARSPITGADVERILSASPWLLVLDGLDEVPVSSGREPMLAALRDALGRLAGNGARGFVLGTTRPQGYGGELELLDLETLHLEPLSPERALAYAQRLVAMRFADRPDRQEKILDRMEQASHEQATARLMRSPLQVTIMATLVDRIGRAPQERWSLFQDYYRVIYEREMERPGPAAELLRKHRGHIDRIHAKVGLLLQVESERTGGTDALMPRARLEEVVEETLIEDDFDRPQRAALKQTILGAALERLVFLVSPQEGRFGFEVRSIQEFMAAWALLSKPDAAVVEARLSQTARATSFRNVFLFAASKCFGELSDLREVITDKICPALNEADEAARTVLAGSRLALEILEEGSALNQPKYARRLMALAARLMDLPPHNAQMRLARVYEEDFGEPPRQAIHERLGGDSATHRLGAWVTLVGLIDRGVAWARSMGEERWPEDHQAMRDIVAGVDSTPAYVGDWLYGQMLRFLEAYPPSFVASLHRIEVGPTTLSRLVFEIVRMGRTDARLRRDDVNKTPLIVWFRPAFGLGVDVVEHVWNPLLHISNPPPAWVPLVSAARFVREPSAHMLVECVREIAARSDMPSIAWAALYVPWPLGACLASIKSIEDLHALPDRAREIVPGDRDDWRAWEERWVRDGVSFSDMLSAPPYCFAGAGIGAPYVPGEQIDWLLERYADTGGTAVRKLIADWFWMCFRSMNSEERAARLKKISPRVFESLLSASDESLCLNFLYFIASSGALDADWVDVLDRIGRDGYVYVDSLNDKQDDVWRGLVKLSKALSAYYVENPTRHGLLWVLAALARAGYAHDLDPDLLSPPRFEDPELRGVAALLLLAQGAVASEAQADSCARLIAEAGDRYKQLSYDAIDMLQGIAEVDQPALHDVAFLIALYNHTRSKSWQVARVVIRTLLTELDQHAATLDDPAVWDRLALPLPKPTSRTPTTPPPPSATAPVHLESLTIRGLRIFEELSISLTPRDDADGQWTLLLGDNGVGKTTILRAIALALAEPAVTNPLLAQLAAPLGRRDAPVHESIVRAREGIYRTRLAVESGVEVALAAGDAAPPRRPPLFGYGVRRGSALGGPARNVDLSPALDVATLFDSDAGLLHAETWLKDLALDAEQNPEGTPAHVYQTVLATLRDILPDVETIAVHDKRVWITPKNSGNEIPLSALSDGYLTTAGWIIDLVARWVDRQRGEALKPGFTRTMTGLVLVDEIDLHLHPRWQCTIVSDLREAFPRMSFVVTTHNPLTLLGARDQEIFVLRRARGEATKSGPVTLRQIDLPKGIRADQILTGAWFGLPSTVDRETQALLDEHRRLLRKRGGGSEERIRELEAELRERLGTFADTALDRLALSVAAQLMDEDYRELTPEERESIQREVKERTRQESASTRGER